MPVPFPTLRSRLTFRTWLLALPVLAAASPALAITFTPGDLVLSIYGNGDGSGPYGDNQAAPIVLQQITTAGALAGSLVLPQTTTVSGGVTQNAISGEYGSSSEGLLSRSADGKSLAIAGYGVAASTFNGASASTYGATKNGSPALAQTTSVPGGAYTAVPRVIASIRADGSVDTSTALFNVDNLNNPRSVATVDGSSFYLSGQGATSTDTTQGVYLAAKGASAATAIDTSTQTRSVQIVNGQLYVSRDDKTTGQATISSYGSGLPTGATTPTSLAGIGPTTTVTASNQNGVNTTRLGTTVYLSPEQYFFADSSTLYIADSGNPKNGNLNKAQLGDGGLQKWVLTNGTWSMQYDISAGLNLVRNSTNTATPTAVTSGTSGLIGLAGTVVGDSVFLYATNATLGDLDPTYVFSLTDSLSATALQAGESFSTIYTAASGTNVRGIAFAPLADSVATSVPEPASLLLLGGMVLGMARFRARR